MSVTNSVHSFAGAYAAGVYVYLWADVMAADAAEVFLASAGGLYDAQTARSWRSHVLSAGHRTRADVAFRNFAGREPSPQALHRRFMLPETSN